MRRGEFSPWGRIDRVDDRLKRLETVVTRDIRQYRGEMYTPQGIGQPAHLVTPDARGVVERHSCTVRKVRFPDSHHYTLRDEVDFTTAIQGEGKYCPYECADEDVDLSVSVPINIPGQSFECTDELHLRTECKDLEISDGPDNQRYICFTPGEVIGVVVCPEDCTPAASVTYRLPQQVLNVVCPNPECDCMCTVTIPQQDLSVTPGQTPCDPCGANVVIPDAELPEGYCVHYESIGGQYVADAHFCVEPAVGLWDCPSGDFDFGSCPAIPVEVNCSTDPYEAVVNVDVSDVWRYKQECVHVWDEDLMQYVEECILTPFVRQDCPDDPDPAHDCGYVSVSALQNPEDCG